MADIQKELKELEEHISSLPLSRIEEAEADLVYAEDELNEAYASMARGDSVTIPQIFVSPARGLALTESQLILIKAQEYARDIIGNAIEINTGMECGEVEILESCMLEGIDTAETQVAFQAREIVQDIIETAMEINNSLQSDSILDINAQHLFETVDTELLCESSLQEQALEKAQELVNEAISKAIEMTSAVAIAENVQAPPANRRHIRGEKGKQQVKAIESQMTMFKAQEIVNRVVGQALEMNLKKIHSEQLQAKKKAKDIRSYKSSDHTVGKYRKKSVSKKPAQNIAKEVNVKKVDSTPVSAEEAPTKIRGVNKTTSSPTPKVNRNISETTSTKKPEDAFPRDGSERREEDLLPREDFRRREAKPEDQFLREDSEKREIMPEDKFGREEKQENQFPKADSNSNTASMQKRKVKSEDQFSSAESRLQRREGTSEPEIFRADSSPLHAKKKSFSGRAKELIRASFQRRFKGTLEKIEERDPTSLPVVGLLNEKQTKCPSCAELMHDAYRSAKRNSIDKCEPHAPKKKRSFPTFARWRGRKKSSSSAGLQKADKGTTTTGEEPYFMHSTSEFTGLSENAREAAIQQCMLRARLQPLNEAALVSDLGSDAKNMYAAETKVSSLDSVTHPRRIISHIDSAGQGMDSPRENSHADYGDRRMHSPPKRRVAHIQSAAPDMNGPRHYYSDTHGTPDPRQRINYTDSAAQGMNGPRQDFRRDHVTRGMPSPRQRVPHIDSAARNMNANDICGTFSSPRQSISHIDSAAQDVDDLRQDSRVNYDTHSPRQMITYIGSAALGKEDGSRQNSCRNYDARDTYGPRQRKHSADQDMDDGSRQNSRRNYDAHDEYGSRQRITHMKSAPQDMHGPRQDPHVVHGTRSAHTPPAQRGAHIDSAPQDMDGPRYDYGTRRAHSPTTQGVSHMKSAPQDLDGPRHDYGAHSPLTERVKSAPQDMDSPRLDYMKSAPQDMDSGTRSVHSPPTQRVSHIDSAPYGMDGCPPTQKVAHMKSAPLDMDSPRQDFHVDYIKSAPQGMDSPRQDSRSTHSPPAQRDANIDSAGIDMDGPRQNSRRNRDTHDAQSPRHRVTRIDSTAHDMEDPGGDSRRDYDTHGSRQRIGSAHARETGSADGVHGSEPNGHEPAELSRRRGSELGTLEAGSEVHVVEKRPKHKKHHHHRKSRKISLQSKSEFSGLNTTVTKHHHKHKDKFVTDDLDMDNIRSRLESIPLPSSHRKKKKHNKSRASSISPRGEKKHRKKSKSRTRRDSKDTTSTRRGKKTKTNLIVPDSTTPSHSDVESASPMSDETSASENYRIMSAIEKRIYESTLRDLKIKNPKESLITESHPVVEIIREKRVKSGRLDPNHRNRAKSAFSMYPETGMKRLRPTLERRNRSLYDWRSVPGFNASTPLEKFYAISKRARKKSSKLFKTRSRPCVSAPVKGEKCRYYGKRCWSEVLSKHASVVKVPRRVYSLEPRKKSKDATEASFTGNSLSIPIDATDTSADSSLQWKSAPVYYPNRHHQGNHVRHRDPALKSSASTTSASGPEHSLPLDSTSKQTSSSIKGHRHYRNATSATASTSGLDHSMVTDRTERSNLSMALYNTGKPVGDSTPFLQFPEPPDPELRSASLPSNKNHILPPEEDVLYLSGRRSDSLSRRQRKITVFGSKKGGRVSTPER